MKYIRFFLFILSCSCSSKLDVKDPDQMIPPYKFLNLYSRKIEPKTGLKLSAYAYNLWVPKEHKAKKDISSLSLSYSLRKNKKDFISLNESRNLIIYIVENLLTEVNRNEELKPDLDIYPFTNKLLSLNIHFEDENRIDLGQGVAHVYLFRGKIVYEGYDIIEYRSKFPALGKHYVMHEESYEEALDIVKREGNLTYLD